MPDVRMPDGTIIRNVPEGTTKAQLMARLSKAKGRGGIMGTLNNIVSSGNELLLGGVETAYNAASAITDPIARAAISLVGGEEEARQTMAAANRGRRDVVSGAERTFISQPNPIARNIGRIGAAVALPVPKIALAGKLVSGGGRLARGARATERIGNRAIQGAVGGAAVREVDESAAAPAAIGAAANIVVPPILSRVAQTRPAQAVGRAIGRAAAPIIGMADDAAEAALPHVDDLLGRQHVPLRGVEDVADDVLAPLGRQAQARAARFNALGVENPTTGMVTRDPAAFSFEQNTARLQGFGDDLANQMREVEAKLVDKGRSLVRDLGGSKGPEATGKAVEEVLDTKRGEMQQVTSQLYKQARETRGEELVGRLNNLRERMTDPDVVDNAVFDQMREGLVRRMTRLGAIGKDGSLSKPLTVAQAEELRKFIGGLGNGIEPGVRMMRGRLIDALDDDVVGAIGDDAFKAARASAKARFDEFGKTFPGKLADEKLPPERLTSRILGDGVSLSDLRALKRSLHTGTPDQIARGQEAWRGLQAQAIDDLLGKAVDPDGNLIGSRLSSEFSKHSIKFRALLGPDDFKVLRRLASATRDVKAYPSGHSVNTSNTATTLANMFNNAPAHVREGWLRLMGKVGLRAGAHVAAAAAGGPAGNIAVESARAAGSAAVAGRAEQRAAEALMNKIRLAQNPEAAAAAIREAQAAAASNAAIAEILNSAGFGKLVGGVAAQQP